MTNSLIEKSDKFLTFFVLGGGIRHDKEIEGFIKENDLDITVSNIVNVLVAYKLIERSPANGLIKHLTPDGFKAAEIGTRKYLRKKRQNEYINELWFKILVFSIPTIISIVSAYFTYRNYERQDRSTERNYTKYQVDSLFSTFKKELNRQNNSTKYDSTEYMLHDTNKLNVTKTK
jgi:hypothetical protein